ncbi:MAG: LytR/AlgR family response regulator transcription factor, partial [Bacteroidia bacterium]
KNGQTALEFNRQLNAREKEIPVDKESEPAPGTEHAMKSDPASVTGKKTEEETIAKDLITFIAENEKDKITLAADELIYVESADNYSTVYYKEKKAVRKSLLRSSLKRMEAHINNRNIKRCHRSYIVNLMHVTKIEGNAAGYYLIIEGIEQSIPVSRNYASNVLAEMSREK